MSKAVDNINLESTKRELIEVSRFFYSKGWMMGTSGNLSIYLNDSFLITASGKDKGILNEDDFILVDGSGNAKSEGKPSAETLLHASIYKNTGAKAIYHVHTSNSTLVSMMSSDKREVLEFEGLEMLKGLGFKTHEVKISIPIIENNQDMKYVGDIAPNYINEDIPGILLKGHGIYAWGNSPSEAKRHVEIFEFLFDYRIKELSITNS